jgi:subtilisin family serine protease
MQASVLVEADGALEAFPELINFVPPVRVDLPTEPRSWEAGDQALIDAVRAEGGRVFIGFKPVAAERTRVSGIAPGIAKADALEWRSRVEAMGASIVQTFRNSATVVAVIDPESALDFSSLPFVNFVEPEVGFRPLSTSADASGLPRVLAALTAVERHDFPVQDTSWGVFQVRAPAAWAANRGWDANITILDHGVDSAHVNESGGDAFLALLNCLHSEPSFTTCYPPTNDADGHGSLVYSVAAARNNAYGWIGIAPLVGSVSSVRICDPFDCPAGAVVAGLNWVATNGIGREIVNMSFGAAGDIPTEAATALANAYNSGALLIAAAGNTPDASTVPWPANDWKVMAVSGTREGDVFADEQLCQTAIGFDPTVGSVSGSQVEISAPFTTSGMWSHLRYNNHCGTSFSTPVVAGVAALVWTKWPSWSASQVRSRLTSTAKDLGPPGRDVEFGYGRVDAQDALFKFSALIVGPAIIFEPGTYQWGAGTSPTNGGDGSYTYQWAESYNGTTWWNVGTSQSFSRYVGPTHPNFHLRVTITSAGYGGSKTIFVLNHSGGCSPCE